MAKTAVATQQTAWQCKWSRPGFRLAGVDDSLQPESLWICVRTGQRRPVSDEKCDGCPFWEADEFRMN